MRPHNKSNDPLIEETPAIWLLRLECYRAVKDSERAAEARNRLRELGVEVRYIRRRRKAAAHV